MRKKIKRTTKQYFIVALICIVVIGGAAMFTSLVITGQIREEYQALLAKAHKDMKENQRNVYVASADILAGDYITKDNVVKKTVYSSQPEDIYITDKGIGKVALVNISAGTQLINSMLTENAVTSELRELEYNVIHVSSNIKSNDTVDIRIFYPNGESYVVLSKKIMKGYLPETATCYLWLDEEELLRMSAAIVDAGLYQGSILYVTKYIEPSIQEASDITYTPSLSILSLLESDPNIVERYSQELNKEVRKALENRLADSLATDVSAINWNVNPNVNFINDETLNSTNEDIEIAPVTTLTPSKVTKAAAAEDTANASVREGAEEALERIPEEAPQELSGDSEKNSELGKTEDYFYYAEEEAAKEEDTEYGE